MQDISHNLTGLSRPPLLVRAAQYGAGHYNRKTMLPRVLGFRPPTENEGDTVPRNKPPSQKGQFRRKFVAAVAVDRVTQPLPAPKQAVCRLLEIERDFDRHRRQRHPAYAPGRHVLVLSALIAEWRVAFCGER
jgi:hypothetical protein